MSGVINVYDRNTGGYVKMPVIKGESAYQYAVDGGFTGTEEEFRNLMANSITVEEAKLAVYSVGSIYISSNSTSPAELFGGTWEQIKDLFPLAAGDIYAAGSTGGEATHTLDIDEMPAHDHNVFAHCIGGDHTNRYAIRYNAGYDGNDGNQAFIGTSGYSGGSEAHNNMPPYKAYYMWERVA